MAGHTNRLNLYLPGGGSSGLYLPDEQLDVDRINDNMKLIDAAIGYSVVTSTTRPGTPYIGQPIFETDTQRFRLWNGATWSTSNPERGTAALFIFADVPALTAFIGMVAGDIASIQTTGALYRYSGTAWVPNRAAARLTRASDFTLSAAFTSVPFDAAPVLSGLTWVIGSPTRITCVTAGSYLVTGDWIINTTTNGQVRLRKNGATGGGIRTEQGSAGAAVIAAAFPIELAVGDYFEVQAQSSAAFPWSASNVVNVDQLSAR